MILDRSQWLPQGQKPLVPVRRILRTAGHATGALPRPAPATGNWPSFRGPEASGVADGQRLPDQWNPTG
jgi:outer membrane protein assembly factor BamB